MKAIILARVSDKGQDSNKAQIARVSEYIAQRSLTVWLKFELEESSTKGDRRRFKEIIKHIQQSKEPIALVVDTVDRLQRSFKESVLLDDLRKAGKLEIHFYRESLVINKNSNSADLLRWDMAVIFARSYVLQLSDNITRKLEQMRNTGEWISKPQIGYMSVYKDGERIDIMPDDRTSWAVMYLFEQYATGTQSLLMLKNGLVKQGFMGETGKPLSVSRIHRILNNPFYYGEMRTKGKLYKHRYQPLITKDLFNRCQSVMRGWKKKPHQYAAKPYIFRGLLRCAKCGCAMSPETAKGKYTYYSCTNGRREICNVKQYVPEPSILDHVYAFLEPLNSISSECVDEVLHKLRVRFADKSEYHTAAVNSLQMELGTNEAKINHLLDLVLDKTITKAEYEIKLAHLKERQTEIRQAIESHTEGRLDLYATAEVVFRLARNALEIFKSESSEVTKKRRILNLLVQNSVVRDKIPIFYLRSPFYDMLEYFKLPNVRRHADRFGTKIDWLEVTNLLEKLGYIRRITKRNRTYIEEEPLPP